MQQDGVSGRVPAWAAVMWRVWMEGYAMGHRSDFPKRLRWRALAGLVLAGAVSLAPAAEPAKPAAIRVVGCEEAVQSPKRGVGANFLRPEDFVALAPGVSWWYDWGHHLGDTQPPAPGIPVRFIPMAWGDRPEDIEGLEKHLAAGNKPPVVLGINEPNLREQCFIPPQQAAAFYKRIKAVADRYGIPVVGPQMAIGSAPKDSIVALDPLENRGLTYTFMVPYLKAMAFYLEKSGTELGAIGIHPYGSADELRGLTQLTHQTFKRPVWVTEFNFSNAKTEQEQVEYLIRAVDFLERMPYVQGYAWFKERIPNTPSLIALLQEEPGKLTRLGEVYVAMPVHDPGLYYRLPGRLQAERYVRLEKGDIWPTWDADGLAHMASKAPGAWLEYNLQVDQPGVYAVTLRATGQSGGIEILAGAKVLGAVTLREAEKRWTTLSTTVTLEAGPQTLRVRFGAAGQGINWIEFARP